jgi:hypothetical protein
VSIPIAIIHHRSAWTVSDLTTVRNFDFLLGDGALVRDDNITRGTLGIPIARRRLADGRTRAMGEKLPILTVFGSPASRILRAEAPLVSQTDAIFGWFPTGGWGGIWSASDRMVDASLAELAAVAVRGFFQVWFEIIQLWDRWRIWCAWMLLWRVFIEGFVLNANLELREKKTIETETKGLTCSLNSGYLRESS